MRNLNEIERIIILDKNEAGKISKISLKYFRKEPIILTDIELIEGILIIWIGKLIGVKSQFETIQY